MALYKGDRKLSLWKGDRKPFALFKGDKQIAGAVKKMLKGTESISFESVYNAKIPSLKTYGMGFQGFKTGKNIMNEKQFLNLYTWKFENGFYTGQVYYFVKAFNEGFKFDYPFKANTQYTISVTSYVDGNSTPNISIRYTDGTYDSIDLYSKEPKHGVYTTLPNKTIEKIIGTYATGGADIMHISEFQIEEGTVATPYEPYWQMGDRPLLSGSQLIPYPYRNTTKTENGITFTDNGDGSITINGTATKNATFELYYSSAETMNLSPNTDYTIAKVGTPTTIRFNVSGVQGGERTGWVGNLGNTRQLDENWTGLYAYILVYKDYTANNETIYPAFNKGTTILPYEPYIGGTPAPNPMYPVEPVWNENNKIKLEGKNLIPYPYVETTITKHGITFTDNKDGTITANGTATGIAIFVLQYDIKPAQTDCILSGCPKGGNYDNGYCLNTWDGKHGGADEGNGFLYTVNNWTAPMNVTIRIAKGVTVNNLVFKPMLNKGTTPARFQPYTPPQQIDIPVLRAIPNTEYRDEYDEATGVITRRIKEMVITGDESWLVYQLPEGVQYYFSANEAPPLNFVLSNYARTIDVYDRKEKYNSVYITEWNNGICFNPNMFPTVESWIAWLKENQASGKPVKVWYPLKTPTTETVTTPPLVQHMDGTLTQFGGDCRIGDMDATVFTEYEK